jgi:magnesium transporter
MFWLSAVTEQKEPIHSTDPRLLPDLLKNKQAILWVDLEAPTSEEIGMLSKVFGFHPLAIEDCLSDVHLPKVDDFGDYLFLILHGIKPDAAPQFFTTPQLNFFLSKNYLVTFHRQPSRSIQNAKDRCVQDAPPLSKGLDLLLHQILDRMVDNYFPILDEFDHSIDRLEGEVFNRASQKTLNKILKLKRDLMQLRRIVGPQREIFNRLSRDEFPVITKKADIYFRDIYDHLVRIWDLTESYRDLMNSSLEAYLSVVSNRLNEIMKILTIFTAILMPLTVITGIYGMNFKYMPELEWRYGYFIVLGVMAVISIGLLYYFRTKKWL